MSVSKSVSMELEANIRERFDMDKPTYELFGKYILDQVISGIEVQGEDPKLFFEIPPNYRVKDTGSLIQKALYMDKNYLNPYEDITDKVGVRFVVLFTDRMKTVNNIIEEIPGLTFSKDRDYKEEQQESPIAFSYQSDHYVVRPSGSIAFRGVCISNEFCCEIQVRSLMQHAYAQITHDIFYKPSIVNDDPEMKRQVARCMAIMEIADEKFNGFIKYNRKMEKEMPEMLKCLQSQYAEKLGRNVKIDLRFDRTMLMDLDKEGAVSTESVLGFFNSSKGLSAIKKLNHILEMEGLELYEHVSAMFVVYLLMKGPTEKRRLITNWGFNRQILEDVFADFGLSYEGFQMS